MTDLDLVRRVVELEARLARLEASEGGGGTPGYPAVSGLTTGQPLRATGAAAAAFGPLDMGNTDATTGVLPGSRGGTGVNNGANQLTVPATGTAALRNVANTFTAGQEVRAGRMRVGTNAAEYTDNPDGGLTIGDTMHDYTPTGGLWNTKNTTLLLNGLNFTTIGFHDASARVDFFRVGGGVITLGYDGGFGPAQVATPGGIQVEGWIAAAFAANWGNWGAPFLPVSFCRDPFGWVCLRGLARRSAANGSNTTIFTLPVGYRPIAGVYLFTCVSNGDTFGRIDIGTDGNVNAPQMNNNAGAWISLDGIRFRIS